MFAVTKKQLALMIVAAAVALSPVAVAAQSSGGSGGGSSGGGGGSASGGSSGSTGAGAGATRGAGSLSPRGAAPRSGTSTTNPAGPRNDASPTTTPALTTPAQERTRQRTMDLRNSDPTTPQAAEPGETRGRTSDVGPDDEPSPNSGALPERVNPDRSQPNELSAGGSARQGAVGKTMAECEAAWDAETHMSKEKWRDTCRRTLTAPHL